MCELDNLCIQQLHPTHLSFYRLHQIQKIASCTVVALRLDIVHNPTEKFVLKNFVEPLSSF